ncbi:hypothetical protein QVG61_09195 [Thiohalobacter sp. IOR34]|uniref:DUF6573 family protein n=1 Tax=Thiohalobacter sp. IOR34 TaxID=3057176 RepID=UPI0025B1B954|nr:DUF6573 family protein [Thiohalobacter sp. IOR34]WJW74675.1 hypothetical protein QVG61_09195 [Thiohalobacter sp. IOR34]
MNDKQAIDELFGEVIHAYTRAQAIEDGVLVDVSETAREAGFRWPVALTRAAWADCVAWTEDDNHRQVYQDESGRLWDVLWMAFNAIRGAAAGKSQIVYQLYRVPRDGKSVEARLTALKLVAGPGDAGEPVVTIMLPGED